MISPTDAKCALFLRRDLLVTEALGQEWIKIPAEAPFPAYQKVNVDAVLTDEGQLTAKVKYTLRGENELLLRVAFHQTPKEKWRDIAGLLAISDGFRGQVTNVEAADPLVTEEPFTVEYELTQLKFVDWSKKPVRIPALLPQIGLPDAPAFWPPAKPHQNSAGHTAGCANFNDTQTARRHHGRDARGHIHGEGLCPAQHRSTRVRRIRLSRHGRSIS